MHDLSDELDLLLGHPGLRPRVRAFTRDGRGLSLHVAHADAPGFHLDIVAADLQLDLLSDDREGVHLVGTQLLLGDGSAGALLRGRPTSIRLRDESGRDITFVCRDVRLRAGDGDGCLVCGNEDTFVRIGEATQRLVMRDGALSPKGAAMWLPSAKIRCGKCGARSGAGGRADEDARQRVRVSRR